MNPKKIRLTLDVTPTMNALLVRLAVKTGGTKSQVMRRAIVLFGVALGAKDEGRRILFKKDGESHETEIIIS